jgi:hypothetical protein
MLTASNEEVRFARWCEATDLKAVPQPAAIEAGGLIWRPDFWIPALNTYVEVKPWTQWAETERVIKLAQFLIKRGESITVWLVEPGIKFPHPILHRVMTAETLAEKKKLVPSRKLKNELQGQMLFEY